MESIVGKTCITCGHELSGAEHYCLVCALECGLSDDEREIPSQIGTPDSTSARLAYFDDYELLEEIDRGGMGVVYKARQVSLNRTVAVKMILTAQLNDRNAFDRFQQESRASAQLNHPNIVGIHEVGEHEGCPYFSMEFIKGESLDRFALRQALTLERVAELCQLIALAVHYAHEKGILHRDIKPSNILIDDSGQPHVLDFGLAKEIETDSNVTLAGQVLGSPNYMAPEQVSDRFGETGITSDVYSLGAVLFQLLTGRPPFRGQNPAQTMHLVVSGDLVAPRALNPLVPKDLETICLRALEKESRRRFLSANEFAEELGRFLRGEPIESRPLRLGGKTWRWCRRKPALAGLSLALVVTCFVGSISVFSQWRQSETHRMEAKRLLYSADLNLAHMAIEENNFGRAKDLLTRHEPLEGELDFRGWEWRYLSQLASGDELLTLGQHDHLVTSVAYSPDGQFVASGSFDGYVKVWDVAQGQLIASRRLGDSDEDLVWSVDYSPDGEQLAIGTEAGLVSLWNSKTMELMTSWTNDFNALRLSFSPNGQWLGVGGIRRVQLWNVIEQCEVAAFDLDQNWRVKVGIAFSRDGRWFAFNQGDGLVGLYDLEQSQRVESLVLGAPSTSLAFSPTQSILASGSRAGIMRIWDLETREPIGTLTDHSAWVSQLQFTPDGSKLVSASADQTLKVWDTKNWECLSMLRGHYDEVWDFELGADGQSLVTGGKDDLVKLWSLETREGPSRSVLFSNPIEIQPIVAQSQGLRLSPDGNRALIWGADRGYGVWWADTLEREVFWSVPDEVESTAAGAISGTLVAFGGAGGNIAMLDPKTNKVIGNIDAGMTDVWGIQISNRSDRLAAIGPGGRVSVFDIASRQLIYRDEIEQATVFSLAFSDDGTLMAVGLYNGDALLIDLKEQTRVFLENHHRDQIGDVAISSDNQLLATASADGSIKLLRISEQTLEGHFIARLSGFFAIDFSPDDRRVVAGSGNGQVKMWDIVSEQEVLTLKANRKGAANGVRYIKFLPDDETLLLVQDGGWTTWKAPPLSKIGVTKATTNR